MTLENPSTSDDSRGNLPPEYSSLDFNAPATVGVVLYESQRIRSELRGEDRRMENSIRADMVAMERSLREEMARNTRTLLTTMITLNGITIAAVGAMIKFL
jgi:hypothetical protein